MNVYDSQRLGDLLEGEDYTMTSSMEEADCILLNTCHIREKATEKLYSDLGRVRVMCEENPQTTIIVGVIGCTAQAEGEEIIRRLEKGEKVVAIDYTVKAKFSNLPTKKVKRQHGVSAFLTIQEGCDKFCTFCVVPYTRGAEVSRTVDQIVHEAERLADAGVSEITLLGQNVNGWHGKGADGSEWRLGALLFRLAEVKGLRRLRYTTSHPRNMDNTLIAAHRDLSILMPYLHLPVQAGSDRILHAMNRRHTVSDYLRLVERIRTARPDIALSGDFIVGFPGETDADFEKTLKLADEVFYASAYSFKYSSRPGTPGTSMAGQVDRYIMDERLQRLQALLNEQQRQFLRSKVGTVTDILLEKTGRHEGQMIGRSPWLTPVAVQTRASVGTVVNVVIQKAMRNSFIGTHDGK